MIGLKKVSMGLLLALSLGGVIESSNNYKEVFRDLIDNQVLQTNGNLFNVYALIYSIFQHALESDADDALDIMYGIVTMLTEDMNDHAIVALVSPLVELSIQYKTIDNKNIVDFVHGTFLEGIKKRYNARPGDITKEKLVHDLQNRLIMYPCYNCFVFLARLYDGQKQPIISPELELSCKKWLLQRQLNILKNFFSGLLNDNTKIKSFFTSIDSLIKSLDDNTQPLKLIEIIQKKINDNLDISNNMYYTDYRDSILKKVDQLNKECIEKTSKFDFNSEASTFMNFVEHFEYNRCLSFAVLLLLHQVYFKLLKEHQYDAAKYFTNKVLFYTGKQPNEPKNEPYTFVRDQFFTNLIQKRKLSLYPNGFIGNDPMLRIIQKNKGNENLVQELYDFCSKNYTILKDSLYAQLGWFEAPIFVGGGSDFPYILAIQNLIGRYSYFFKRAALYLAGKNKNDQDCIALDYINLYRIAAIEVKLGRMSYEDFLKNFPLSQEDFAKNFPKNVHKSFDELRQCEKQFLNESTLSEYQTYRQLGLLPQIAYTLAQRWGAFINKSSVKLSSKAIFSLFLAYIGYKAYTKNLMPSSIADDVQLLSTYAQKVPELLGSYAQILGSHAVATAAAPLGWIDQLFSYDWHMMFNSLPKFAGSTLNFATASFTSVAQYLWDTMSQVAALVLKPLQGIGEKWLKTPMVSNYVKDLIASMKNPFSMLALFAPTYDTFSLLVARGLAVVSTASLDQLKSLVGEEHSFEALFSTILSDESLFAPYENFHDDSSESDDKTKEEEDKRKKVEADSINTGEILEQYNPTNVTEKLNNLYKFASEKKDIAAQNALVRIINKAETNDDFRKLKARLFIIASIYDSSSAYALLNMLIVKEDLTSFSNAFDSKKAANGQLSREEYQQEWDVFNLFNDYVNEVINRLPSTSLKVSKEELKKNVLYVVFHSLPQLPTFGSALMENTIEIMTQRVIKKIQDEEERRLNASRLDPFPAPG